MFTDHSVIGHVLTIRSSDMSGNQMPTVQPLIFDILVGICNFILSCKKKIILTLRLFFFFKEPNEAIESLVNGFLATIAMLRNPGIVNRPVPLLHDLAFEAVHALEVEKKSRSERLGRLDEFESEFRRKIVSFLESADSHLQRICQLFEESRANAAMIEQHHQVVMGAFINAVTHSGF